MSAATSVQVDLASAVIEAQTGDLEENLARWLRFVGHEPGQPFELQALKVKFGYGGDRSYFAHARTLEEGITLATKSAREHECAGLYVIANRIRPEVATRAEVGKWHVQIKGEGTNDSEIACRDVLFVDVDVPRPPRTSATDPQVAVTFDVAREVDARIARVLPDVMRGFGHSGNGAALFIALDHIEDEIEAGPLVRGLLAAIEALHSREGVAEIDTSVTDRKRLCPAWGTTKKKGAAGLAERPHRRTAFVYVGGRRATADDLRALLDDCRAELDADGKVAIDKAMGIKAPPRSATTGFTSSPSDDPFARAKLVPIGDVLAWLALGDTDRPVCPACGLSDSGVAVVGNGLKCSHNRCADKGYAAGFRTTIDVVVEARGVSAVEAVKLMSDRFGFAGFRDRDRTRAASAASSSSPPSSARPLAIAPAARVRALAELGPVVRLPTGLETFDKACRGGLPTPRLVVLGGAPGAGKTSLATFFGWRWARAGIPVAFLAVDEGPEGVLTRIAQLEGLDAERIEARDAATLERLSKIVEDAPLAIVDAEDPAGTVEAIAEMLAGIGPDGPRVLVVDSIQTVRAAGTAEADSPRERVAAVVRAAKLARDRYGLLVIATCELARGAYRSRNVAEAINDLAAFKESGDIEYAAQTALVLRSVPDAAGLVDVTVPKNRALRREPFRLRLDHRTTAFDEVALPVDAAPDVGAKLEAVRCAVVRAVALEGLFSARSVVRALRLTGQRFRDADVFEAIRVMQHEGVLGGGSKEPFRVQAPAEAEAEGVTEVCDGSD